MASVVALSQEFHNRIGEKATSELAGWLNTMDTNVRNDIKESMERSFAVFRAEMHTEFARIDARFEGMEAKFESRLSKFESALTWKMVAFWIGTVLSTIA